MTDHPNRSAESCDLLRIAEQFDNAIRFATPAAPRERECDITLHADDFDLIAKVLRTAAQPEKMPTSRPVAFRVPRVVDDKLSKTEFRLFDDEDEARRAACDIGADYDGLFLVADRRAAFFAQPDPRLSADSEPVAFINNRLADLAEANALYGKDQRLSAPDKIARNEREISWLKELRSIIKTEPQSSGVWQPIETAPKDKVIMLCVEGYQPASGRWWPVDSCWTSFDWEGHFESDAEVTQYVNGCHYTPTHWMPLPAGPSVSRPHLARGDE